MSVEKNIQEAVRWLKTAEDDIDSAIILKKNGKFPHSCFHAQQAGKKAVKAAWYFLDADPWGHSIKKLIEDLQAVDIEVFDKLKILSKRGMVLDRFYFPTRYPNGLPDLTPGEAYVEEDAEVCIDHAAKIIENAKNALKI